MTNTWIIAVDPAVSTLVELGRTIGGTVTAVVVGNAVVKGVDALVRIPLAEGTPAEAASPAVAAAVAAEPGDVVLAGNKPAERVLAGAVAALKKLPVLYGLKKAGAGTAELSRFGGIAVETCAFESAVVAVLDGGVEPEGEAPNELTGPAQFQAATVTSVDKREVAQVNLTAAKRIVAAGRGFKAKEDLQLAEDLAATLEAEVACSRPLAEGSEWMPRDRYVGISGQQVSPELYVALGISGQIQHTAGMQDSKTVVVINNDEKAPIFAGADYVVVGDLYEVLPALTQALK